MLKKFFYACAAIMCLAIAFHFGATKASALGGNIVKFFGNEAVLLANGEIWTLNPGVGWTNTGTSVPIPASNVAFFPSRDRFVDVNNNGWGLVGSTWTNYGEPGSGPTPANQQTFGALKAKYR